MDVLICTGDRDALQLVNDHVTVLYPRRGVSEMTRFTPDAVQDKYGLTPAQYPDFAALRGDPSDNLPNIPGVGEKTAAKWVREYGSLAALVEQVDTVKGKVGDALREHLASVLRNRRLTELVRDVGVDVTARRARPAAVGPRAGARAVRRPAVPGAARAAVPVGRLRRARGGGGLRCRLRPARHRRGRAVARRARAGRLARRGRLSRAMGARHRVAERGRARGRRRVGRLPRPGPAQPC